MRLTEEQLAAHQARIAGAKVPPPLERDVQAEVLDALTHCSCVAWRHRMNTGGMKVERKPTADNPRTERYIAFAFEGCSDIIGQLRDGRFLAVECKRKGENPTPEQQAFLTRVAANGGIAFVARCAEDVFNHLRRELQGKARA